MNGLNKIIEQQREYDNEKVLGDWAWEPLIKGGYFTEDHKPTEKWLQLKGETQ
jgi:hypothetical protein